MVDSQLLVVGDVHGCFNTFRQLVQSAWRPQDEILVQVGDLIDRGNYTPECVALARSLESRFAGRAIFLKGNHEFEAVVYHDFRSGANWLNQGGQETLEQYKNSDSNFSEDVEWMRRMPLSFESESVLVSHAGITDTEDPYRETNPRGLLWNRQALKNIGKLQVIGHTPLPTKAEFREQENVWNIDTGAYKGNTLSALRLDKAGKVMEHISIATDAKDLNYRPAH